MTKPGIVLEGSKSVVAKMAARIYSARITRGDARKGEGDECREQSIREAVRIAKTVERSVETEGEPIASEDAYQSSGNTPHPPASEIPSYDEPSSPNSDVAQAKSEWEAAVEALSGKDTPKH